LILGLADVWLPPFVLGLDFIVFIGVHDDRRGHQSEAAGTSGRLNSGVNPLDPPLGF
jgi:hypothetical protein